jgi:6-phosphofructokinase 1
MKRIKTSRSTTKYQKKPSVGFMSRVALLCSGGDGPGMNPAIRSIVRTCIGMDIRPYGVYRGYAGLVEGNFKSLTVSSVGNILQRGGTILKTSRCPEFLTKEGREQAYKNLKKNKIDGLIVIGGDGSFKGIHQFYLEHRFPVVGIPGTIDNDIAGTDYSIGFDTAVQTAVEAVDKIRDTASSHERVFLVEVMGRHSPALALHVGVCTGAENILFSEESILYEDVVQDIRRGFKRGKSSSIIIVAEGEKPGLSYKVQECLKKNYKMQAHVCILGHIQRGGVPSPTDRFVASEMGHLAVKALVKGMYPTVTSLKKGEVVLTALKNCLKKKVEVKKPFIDLAKALSI